MKLEDVPVGHVFTRGSTTRYLRTDYASQLTIWCVMLSGTPGVAEWFDKDREVSDFGELLHFATKGEEPC